MRTDGSYGQTADGLQVQVPAHVDLEHDTYARMSTPREFGDFFNTHSYVVMRGCIPEDLCTRLRETFVHQVKASTQHFPRFGQVAAGPHRLAAGVVVNGVRDVQQLRDNRYSDFVQASLDVLTQVPLLEVIHLVLGEGAIVGQTAYFEGNRGTATHADLSFAPEGVSRMITSWIAIEDIGVDAGRVFIYRQPLIGELGDAGSGVSTQRGAIKYLGLVRKHVMETNQEAYAPALRAGDALLFDGRILHGSLCPETEGLTRHSLVAHYFPPIVNLAGDFLTSNGVNFYLNPATSLS